MNFFQKSIQFILKNRFLISIITLFLCVISFVTISKNIKVDNSIQIWFLDDDPIFKDYLAFQKEQGSDEVLFLMINSDNVFSKKNIEILRNLHKKIEALDNVNTSFSIAKVQYPIYANKKLYFKNIIEGNRSEKAIQNLFKKLPNIRDNLINTDKTKSFFIIQLNALENINVDKAVLHNQIINVIESEINDYKISGGSIVMEEINKAVAYESAKFVVIVSIVVVFLLILFLPQVSYLVIAMITVIVPVILLFGLYVATGAKLNMISSLIPTIIMVYAVSDIIHILNIYHKNKKEKNYKTNNDLIIQSLQQSLKPCFFTTITTIVGYLALTLSPLPAFKVTGFFTFIGLILAFLFSYILTAIGFSFLTLKVKKPAFSIPKIDATPFLKYINYITTQYKKTIISIFTLLFLIGLYAISLIKINSNTLNLLPDGIVKEDLQSIEKHVKGSVKMTLDILCDNPDVLFSNKTLNSIEKFQNKIQTITEISTPVSIIDYKNFFEKRYSISQTGKKMDFNTFKTKDDSFYKMVSKDFKRISINVNTLSLSSDKIDKLLHKIKADFNETFKTNSEIRLKINGYHPLFLRSHQHIITTQIRSFTVAFVFSFIILIYFIKRIRTSLLSLIPNLLPLLLTVIVMVVFGINLETSNAMIAPIMIGIAMDDTIHLIHKYQRFKKAGFTVEQSMDKAMLFVGNAVFSTTITLTIGFAVLLSSSLKNMMEFGLLCSLTILFAFLADAILLPTLIKAFDKA
ncbi:MAG: MMPL family transporter [Flavobacteriaceae bacterium]